MTLPVLVWGPAYTPYSAGIRALYALADELALRGLRSAAPDVAEPASRTYGSRAVYVLPEGQPLPAPAADAPVIRWLLGRHRPFEGEAVAWWPEWFPDCEELRIPLADAFRPGESERTLELVYFGKEPPEPEITSGPVTVIGRGVPATERGLAELLRHGKVLRCYDPMTYLVQEAVLCGCPVILKHPERAPRTLLDLPGVFTCTGDMRLVRPGWETAGAQQWYELERKRNTASIDAFAERLAAL